MAIKRQKIHFQTVDELLGAPEYGNKGAEDIEISKILPFNNHPFKVLDDDKMDELVESIKQNGVLTPVLVRPLTDGQYEMISGHRRLHATSLAGLTTIPSIIKDMTDNEAILYMVDSNVQREEILPSERAFALKMKYDVIKNQKKSGTEFHNLKSREKIGIENGISGRQVQKYIRLTNLIPQWLELIDSKKITITIGVEISYLSTKFQEWILEYYFEKKKITVEQIDAIKDIEVEDKEKLYEILDEKISKVSNTSKITLSDKTLNRYFPSNMPLKEREKIIIELLEKWKATCKV